MVHAATAPRAVITNHAAGQVSFEVTADVLAGAEHGWLVTRDDDVGSKVAFYSREGATTTGDTSLGPQLILEYGDPRLILGSICGGGWPTG